MILLKDRLDLDDKVKLTCLPSRDEDRTSYPLGHEYAWGAGWGSSGFTARPAFGSLDLKNFRLNIYNNSMCHNITKVPIDQLDNDVFCAGRLIFKLLIYINNKTFVQ